MIPFGDGGKTTRHETYPVGAAVAPVVGKAGGAGVGSQCDQTTFNVYLECLLNRLLNGLGMFIKPFIKR